MNSGQVQLAEESVVDTPAWSNLSHNGDEELRSGVLRILNRDLPWKSISSVPESMVLPVIDVLQKELDEFDHSTRLESHNWQRKCIKCLRRLADMYGIVPTSFFCSDVKIEGTGPVWGGGFADIWKGRSSQSMMKSNVSGSSVCLKVLRFFTAGNSRQDLLKAFCQEALVWKQLRHPNILPFLGVSTDLFSPSYCLISPWMENGNIVTFLNNNPSFDSTFRLDSVIDIARGVQYLHDFDPPIVHADIRGGNVLITQHLRCVLADFGISLMVETQVPGSTTLSRGSTRWLPPEMMDQSLFNPSYIAARDIYSFGCTIIEIYTGGPPFPHLRSDAAVINEVLHKRSGHPRPPTDSFPSDRLWQLVLECLLKTPGDRPTATSLLQNLELFDLSNYVLLTSIDDTLATFISQNSCSQVAEPDKCDEEAIEKVPMGTTYIYPRPNDTAAGFVMRKLRRICRAPPFNA